MIEYAGLDVEPAHVPAVLVKLITARICGLIEERLTVAFSSLSDLDDPKFYIWSAGMCLYLEYLAMRGQMHYNMGDVHVQHVGDVRTEYQRWSPMFFFAKGNAPGFYALLPHDSYRMMAYELVRHWHESRFKTDKPDEVAFGTTSAVWNMATNSWDIKAPGGSIG